MAAYAALVSLVNTIYNIQNHSRLSTSLDKNQIESLGEKLDFFLDFVENHHSHGGNEEVEVLERQIASSAHAAEDVIEFHIVDRIEPLMARFTTDHEETSSSLLLGLLIYVMRTIMNHPRLSTCSLDTEQIQSLGEKLDLLLDFIENPNSHVSNEEAEVLGRQLVSEARVVRDACTSLKDQLDSAVHLPGTFSACTFLKDQLYSAVHLPGTFSACTFLKDQLDSAVHLPGTFSSLSLDFFVVILKQILNYPRLWTSVESGTIKEFREFLVDTENDLDYFEDLMASEVIVAEDVIESQEAGSTFDHGETSSSSMIDLLKEVNAIKEKVTKVQKKICGNEVVFAGFETSFLPDLQNIIEDMNFLKEMMIKIEEERGFKHLPPTYSIPAASSSSQTGGKTSVVGFESNFDYFGDLMASEVIIAEDVIESQEAGSTFDHGETSSSSMIDLQNEVNAMKEKVTKVQEKICGNEVAFAGFEPSFLPDLQNIIEDMNFLKEMVIKIKEERGFKHLPPTYSIPAASSSSQTGGKTSVVGFESYSIQLLDWLTAEQSDHQIIPITGMGGIGKTTLARKVYEDLLIVQHFYVRAWLTISQEYNVRQLLFHTLSSLGKSTEELDNKTEGELGVLLHKFLYGRRYLIILDDLWSIESWEKISLYFPREEKRSRILVTTRQSDVANHFSSLRLRLDFLDDDKSWELFCEKAFEQGCCPSELENIGRKIVKKCKGLPLSIVVIGGLLGKSSRTQEHWENVEKDLSSIVNTTEENQCFNVLSLSYRHLPAHLKPCFLYLGIFPEDQVIYVSRLIQLWVAEGFLNPNKDQILEEIAKGYIEDLVGRNLLLVRGFSTIGKVKSCSIHDLLRDFCIKVAEKEKFFCLVRDLDSPRDIGSERRLITLERIAEECNPLQSTSLLRSVISEVACHVTSNSRLLRVFSDAHDGSLETAFQHVNLRFLQCPPNPSASSYKLPSSISLLWNLQTLIIVGTHVEVVPPSEIWEMQQLRHLEFYQVFLHDCKPPVSDEQDRIVLRNLQTLQVASIFKFSDEVCKRMPNIKKLSIFFGDNMWGFDTLEYNCFYNIGRLNKLESLHFTSREVPSKFAQNLRLPSSLKKLALKNCKIKWDDLTRIGSLPHLEVLKLDWNSVEGPEWNPIEGEFQRLKYLRISKCSGLRRWNADSCHFPVLEKLVIEELCELDEIPSGIGDIPTLGDIYLVDCSVSVVMSAVSILKEQESYGNEDIHVRVKFWNEKIREEVRKKVELEGFPSHNFSLF